MAIIGTTIRLATWKGDTPAMPAIATVEPNTGETVRPKALIRSRGIIMEIPATPRVVAKSGISAAKEKNGALPEPIRMAETKMMAQAARVSAIAPSPAFCAPLTMVSMAPTVTRPRANISPATIRATTTVNCLPIWSNTMRMLESTGNSLRTRIARLSWQ